MIRIFLLLLLVVVSGNAGLMAQDQSAVILAYHRFGEDRTPSTNVTLEQFEEQLALLEAEGAKFLPLGEIVDRLKNKKPLPEKTIAITVDDAFRSAGTEAWPRLKKRGIPLTIFVSTDAVDDGAPGYLSWEELRTLQAEGVTIGHHGAAHIHMVHTDPEEVQKDLDYSSERFEEELGEVPDLFAYPYGEYSLAIRQMIIDAGFKGAFAQVSGAAGFNEDMYALPRFAINERYGDVSRVRLIVRSKSLPVTDIVPKEPLLNADSNPPTYGFTVDPSVKNLSVLACYPSHLGEAAELLMLDGNRVEVRFDKPFPPGRSRINCTMPAGNGRWYWLGKFFLLKGGRLD